MDIAPAGLTRVFYSDSGSTATEIALKMAFQYWQQRGGEDARRTRFVSLRDAYHGDTIGSVSVGGIDLFHGTYRPLLFESLMAEPGDAADMERLLEQHDGEVAAVIVEPLVQGAAGMRVHPEGYLRDVRDLCDRHGALLIVRRGGHRLRPDRADVRLRARGRRARPPLPGEGDHGRLPAARRHARHRADLRGLPRRARGAPHLLPRPHLHRQPARLRRRAREPRRLRAERTLERLQPKIALLERLLGEIESLSAVGEVRRRGFMCGIELGGFTRRARMGHRVTLEARRRGAIVRPLGDVVILMPPLSISEADLERLVAIVAESIAAATGAEAPVAQPERRAA